MKEINRSRARYYRAVQGDDIRRAAKTLSVTGYRTMQCAFSRASFVLRATGSLLCRGLQTDDWVDVISDGSSRRNRDFR